MALTKLQSQSIDTNITVAGVVTATAFYGDGSNLAGVTSATTATYADNAGVSTSVSGGTVSATSLNISGISTLGNVKIGTGLTTLIVEGDARVTGILTIGTSSITFDGDNNNINVGSAVTITTTQILVGSNSIGSTDFSGSGANLTNLNASNLTTGIVPAARITSTSPLTVGGDLYVVGNISFGGTTTQLNTSQLTFSDPDLVLGVGTTSTFNPTDVTANHGGIAIASTEGSPLVSLNIDPSEVLPTTYKKFMWFKNNTAGLGTDAWLSNYAIGIGSTQFPTGTRFASGTIQFGESDINVVRNINSSGVVTATSATVNGGNLLVGSTSATGTSSQPLQVTGGAYVSGSLGVGVTNPGQKLDVSGSIRASSQLISTVSTGTAPLSVNSTTVVTNLNADLLDGENLVDNADTANTVVGRDSNGDTIVRYYTSSTTNSNQAYAGQHNVNAPFYNTFSQTSAQYQAIVKGRCTGSSFTNIISFGNLHYPNGDQDIVFHRIRSDGTNSISYILSGSGGTLWHSGNDGSGSGLDADTLDGAQPSVSASNSTIVQRHSSGYIYANYFNTTANDVSSGVTKVMVETGNDNFIRHGDAAAIRTFIGAGSGNGLDADTVDGIDSSQIPYGSNANATTNADPSTTLKSGFYDVYQTNAPTATWYSYINIRHNNTGNHYGHQIAGSFFSTGDIYNRNINNGSFGSWTKIWNASNDGSGSGLDADTLDGLNSASTNTASTIVARDASGNFSAGTITATLSGNATTASSTPYWVNGTYGTNEIKAGTGDNATYTTYNMAIRSWWGIGFLDYSNTVNAVLDCRTGNFFTKGSISASGNVTAYSSDRRLKENLKHIETPLEKVQKLNGYTFDWNKKSEELGFTPQHKENDIGLIAQEVQEVLPQAVALAPFDRETENVSASGENYLTVQYERLVPLLVEAIKEQQEQINTLKQEIENLKK